MSVVFLLCVCVVMCLHPCVGTLKTCMLISQMVIFYILRGYLVSEWLMSCTGRRDIFMLWSLKINKLLFCLWWLFFKWHWFLLHFISLKVWIGLVGQLEMSSKQKVKKKKGGAGKAERLKIQKELWAFNQVRTCMSYLIGGRETFMGWLGRLSACVWRCACVSVWGLSL